VRYLPPIAGKSATSATSATLVESPRENVADRPGDVADVAQHVADGSPKNGSNINRVADVADVADLRANGGEDIPIFLRRCDHCGQPGRPIEPLSPYDCDGREILLHLRCEAPWFDKTRAN
jgi:hypothetical protein